MKVGFLLILALFMTTVPNVTLGQRENKKPVESKLKITSIQLEGGIKCTMERSEPGKLEALTGRTTRVRCPLAVDDPTAKLLAVQIDLARRSGLTGLRSDSDMVLEAIISENPDSDRWEVMVSRMNRKYGKPAFSDKGIRIWNEENELGQSVRQIILLSKGKTIEYYWINSEFERLHLEGKSLVDQVSVNLR